MLKKARIFVIILVTLLIVMQFFQPGSNDSPADENHILRQANIPENITMVLSNACFDCHSGQTTYPWYNKVAPVSWVIADHVKKGKKELDFSGWGKLDTLDKVSQLGEIQEEIKSGSMPLRSYALVHPKARLSDAQVREMINWTDELTEQLLSSE